MQKEREIEGELFKNKDMFSITNPSIMIILKKLGACWGPVVRTLCFQKRGHRFDP